MKLLLLLTAILLTACGPSIEEKEEIVIVTCNILSEPTNKDGAVRLKEINVARARLGGDAFLGTHDEIKMAIESGLCRELVSNSPYYAAQMVKIVDIKLEKLEMERLEQEVREEEERIKREKIEEAERIKKEEREEAERIKREKIKEAERIKREKIEEAERIKGEEMEKARAQIIDELQGRKVTLTGATFTDSFDALTVKIKCGPLEGYTFHLYLILKNQLDQLFGQASCASSGVKVLNFRHLNNDLITILKATPPITLIKSAYAIILKPKPKRTTQTTYIGGETTVNVSSIQSKITLDKPIRIEIEIDPRSVERANALKVSRMNKDNSERMDQAKKDRGQGVFFTYHPNNKIELKRTIEGGELTIVERFYTDGQLMFVTHYQNSSKEGIQENYDEDGNLVSKKCFKDGSEVSFAECKKQTG